MAEISATVIEAAATWYVDLQHPNADETIHKKHQQWLAAHPVNQQAWARVEKLQHTLGQAEGNSNTLRSARISRRQSIKALSILLIASGTGSLVWQQQDKLQMLVTQYRTNIGEQHTITLADDGKILLNTQTSIDINYNKNEREILLYAGEILVTTAKDLENRPFIVRTSHGSIRALGTKFSVRENDQNTQVNVYQHAVEIRPANKKNTSLRLGAGQQTSFTQENIASSTTLPTHSDAWHKQLLIVSDWPLSKFLAEVSRYRAGRISCDENIANLRISGAFHLKDTNAILNNITNTLPVNIRYFTRYWVRVIQS